MEVIKVLLLPKDDKREQVKNELFPLFQVILLHSAAGLLLFSTSERLSVFNS